MAYEIKGNPFKRMILNFPIQGLKIFFSTGAKDHATIRRKTIEKNRNLYDFLLDSRFIRERCVRRFSSRPSFRLML